MPPIIFQVIVGLLVLFFIFLTYVNTKTWRWLHVTSMALVFVATLIFCFYAAMVLRTRAAWIGYHDKLEKSIAKETKDLQQAMYGDPLNEDPANPSVSGLREKLSHVLLDRGRVWRGGIPSINRNDGTVTVATSPPVDPNLPPPGPPKKNGILVKTVLHAFREGPATPEGLVVPVAYIGEFSAIAVTDTSVTLAATMGLSQDQIRNASLPGTWTLYEVCPIDGLNWFEGLTPEELLTLMPPQVTGLPPDAYPKLAEFLRGTREATPNDPPKNVWVEVKFIKEYEVVVDAGGPQSIDAEPFNLEGQAVLESLRRAAPGQEPGKVVFGPGENQVQTAVLNEEIATALKEQGICEIGGTRIYRRNLTDYERKFRSLGLRFVELEARRRLLDLDNKALIAATDKANAQAVLLEELAGHLAADLAKGKQEQSELKKYEDSLRARVAEVQDQLSQLYRSNKALSRELEETSKRITDEIERRTRQSTAMRP